VEDTGEALVRRWRLITGRGPNEDEEADGAASANAPAVSRSHFRLKGGGVLVADVVARSDTQVVVDLGGNLTTIDMARIDEEESLTDRLEDPSVNVRRIIAGGFDEFVQNLDEILKLALSVVTWLVNAVYQIFLIMMITAFLVVDREKIVNFMHSVAPQRHQVLSHRLAEYIDRGLAGVIRGQLTICLVNGILTWIGLEFMDVRYALMLGVVAGTLSLIPIFGTIISTIPIVLIALGTSGWEQALLALAWILFIHFVEANFLNPKIMGTASRIHPVVIIFALLAGGHTYGLVGALLAVPIASIIQSTFKFYVIDKQAEIDEEPLMTAT
jgi:predicted PurR-regulated permease PerM